MTRTSKIEPIYMLRCGTCGAEWGGMTAEYIRKAVVIHEPACVPTAVPSSSTSQGDE